MSLDAPPRKILYFLNGAMGFRPESLDAQIPQAGFLIRK